jgi:hypothetical protein
MENAKVKNSTKQTSFHFKIQFTCNSSSISPFKDVDECTQGLCGENMECQNFPGSYACSCRKGYWEDMYWCNGMLSVLTSFVSLKYAFQYWERNELGEKALDGY